VTELNSDQDLDSNANKNLKDEENISKFLHRPWLLKALNWCGALRSTSTPFDPKALISGVEASTGVALSDGEDCIAHLKPLCDSLNSEANLNLIGRLGIKSRIVNNLTQRALLEYWMEKDGEAISEQKIVAPIFIVGLPRTGTTLVQRMLGQGDGYRSLLYWEADNPVPGKGIKPDIAALGNNEPRIRKAIRQLKVLYYLCPKMKAIHYTDALLPEEDCILQDHSLLSQTLSMSANIPSYVSWLEKQDFVRAYEYEKKLLQILQWQRPETSTRWVLKAPMHLAHLAELLQVFPDATVVWTHRDPAKVIPSYSSLMAHHRGMMSEEPSPIDVGKSMLRELSQGAAKAIAFRSQASEQVRKQIVDVYYSDLLADPVGEMKRICEVANIQWTESTAKVMNDFLSTNSQHAYGKHVYDASDFGLNNSVIRNAFASYIDYYQVPDEN